MLNGIGSSAALAIYQRQGDALQARFAARGDHQAEATRFRARATELGSIEALMRDRRSLSMVLESFQLEGEIDKSAIIRKLLTEDPTNERSFANRMVDPRFRALNAAFGGRDGAPLDNPTLVENIIKGAMVNRFEKAAGEGNPGLREALYFRRTVSAVTSVPGLMSDRALTAVVRGALGLPEQFGLLGYERQRDVLAKRLDVANFQDPREVDRLVQRYAARMNEAQSGSSDPRLALLSGGGGDITGRIGRRLSL